MGVDAGVDGERRDVTGEYVNGVGVGSGSPGVLATVLVGVLAGLVMGLGDAAGDDGTIGR